MKKITRRLLKSLLCIVLIAIIVVVVSAEVCTNQLRIKNYTVAIEDIQQDAIIVLISDLHSREFGEKNAELLSAIAEQTPDAICVVGDMLNQGSDEAEIAQMVELIACLQEIAQVYYSPGNTEMDCILDDGVDLLTRLQETGAIALLDDYVETEIGGNRVNVGFTMGHYRYTREQWDDPRDYQMEHAVGADGTPAIVLMHMPETILKDGHEDWTGDLYLCGHTHGGLFRLPGVGGVFAPTQGWFPKYDRGQFSLDGGRFDMIVTAGLAGHGWIPRIFNMPEVSVITLTGR